MFSPYWCPPPVSGPQSEAAGDHSEPLRGLYQPKQRQWEMFLLISVISLVEVRKEGLKGLEGLIFTELQREKISSQYNKENRKPSKAFRERWQAVSDLREKT